ETLLVERTVHAAPPDSALRTGLAGDELVVGRAAGVRAGVDDERPALGEHALPPLERPRVERRRGRISIDGAGRLEAVLRKVNAAAAFGRRHRGIVLASASPRGALQAFPKFLPCSSGRSIVSSAAPRSRRPLGGRTAWTSSTSRAGSKIDG